MEFNQIKDKTTKIVTIVGMFFALASAGMMISVSQSVTPAYAQSSCPSQYPTGPGPGGVCLDGTACPNPTDRVISGKCTDGPATCPEGSHLEGNTCVLNDPTPDCPDGYNTVVGGLCTDGPPNPQNCPPNDDPNFKDPTVNQNGICQVKPGQGPNR